jgi:hypothetical protein
MSHKTISINPSLFSFGGSKTKKSREKKQIPTIKPLISPSVLKNKLLKRIKEHKHHETENLENNKRRLPNDEDKIDLSLKNNDIASYSNEFNESLNYLQTLSKQKKINDEKNNYERQKQKRIEELERKTIKNHNSLNSLASEQLINIDLPEELKQQLVTVNTESLSFGNDTVSINRDQVPYGILKGGVKPTYRDWTKTHRNNIVTNPNAALTIPVNEFNKEKIERETRLNNLREKLKLKQIEQSIQKNEDNLLAQNIIQPSQEVSNSNALNNNLLNNKLINNNAVNNNVLNSNEKIIAIKKITKRTIKRKYTLGRSKIKNTIAVLIKDRGTRKKILNAQKDLKRKNINDVKVYLREHNLIKVGSNAPNDVLRKLYESAMLSGEITNNNAETLLHNFSKDDKEL